MKGQSKDIHIFEIAKVLAIPQASVHTCMEKHRIQAWKPGHYDRAAVMTLSSLFRARGWALEPGDRETKG